MSLDKATKKEITDHIDKELKKAAKDERHGLKEGILEDTKSTLSSTIALITSALTLVAGLAWNDAIKFIFENYVKTRLEAYGVILGYFLYAIFVTVLVVVIITRLKKLKDKIGGETIK